MTMHGHRSAVHDNEIRKERDAYEAENSQKQARLKEEVEKHREHERESRDSQKYESEEKE